MLFLGQPNPINDAPLLGVRDTCRVKRIGELVGRPCCVMPDQACSIVLWDTSPFTLGDEPLAGRVEHSTMELWMPPPKFCIGFDNPVHSHARKQPAMFWQGCVQQLFKYCVQWHLPLRCLRLQLSYGIGTDVDEASQVRLLRDILCHEPTPN